MARQKKSSTPHDLHPAAVRKRSSSSRRKSASGGSRKLAAGGTDVRLQKVLAASGLGSRRSCEELIEAGRVEVDRQVMSHLGTKVNPDQQEIRVDGQVIARPTLRYYMLNKPDGVLCTNNDPAGRLRVLDLIGDKNHLFTIGRLDRSSEGLIIITNDGELANRIAHPRYEVSKVYHVRVAGNLRREDLAEIRQGVYLSDGKAQIDSIRIKSHRKQTTDLEMILSEGKNREIRRVLARIRHKVLMLKRIAIGSVRLGELPVGAYRELTYREISALKKLTNKPARGRKRSGRSPQKKSDNSGQRSSRTGQKKDGQSTKVRGRKSTRNVRSGKTARARKRRS